MLRSDFMSNLFPLLMEFTSYVKNDILHNFEKLLVSQGALNKRALVPNNEKVQTRDAKGTPFHH